MDFFFDLENPLTSFKEHQSDTVPSLFANESVLVLHDFPANFRHKAISLISKLSEGLDPFVPYLAVNYMDRFISTQKIPNQEIFGLVAISCYSLAIKMKNSESFIQLQGYEGLIDDARSINRMEVLILMSLKWRMRSITPFSFLHYFLSLFELEDGSLSQAIKDRASDIIFKSLYEIEIFEFRPSLVAASAILHASRDLIPLQYFRFRDVISSCKYVNKEKMEDCLGVMQDMVLTTNKSTNVEWSGTTTPISVLDHQCTSSESESTRSIKRTKLKGFTSDENRVIRCSHIQTC